MTLISDLHEKWLKNSECQTAYEAQRPEFEIASTIIAARPQKLWRLLVTLLKN